jgi:Flp pilus assembly protein TadG
MFAVFLVIMILFIGLAIDLGYAYVTKANLSKALDAAALRGMLSIAQGATTAGNIAASVFAANYQSSGRDSTMPVPTVTFTPNPPVAGTLTKINVTATTNINTFFARIVPSLQTLTVSDTAQSTRANVMMALVLDVSGSMNDNSGAQALPPAVQTFVSYFSNTLDQVSVSTFSDFGSPTPNATGLALNLAMEHNFSSDVTNLTNSMVGNFGGGTYAQGGLDDAAAQLCGWAVPGVYPYAGACPVVANTKKVVVFFTDGWANTNVDALNGPNCPATPIQYGGCASDEAALGWCGGVHFWDRNHMPNVNEYNCRATNFPVHEPGNMGQLAQNGVSITQAQDNIANEAMYRAMKWANAMRAQGVIVYAVGLGGTINQSYLQQMANDPNGTSFEGSSYNTNTPQGLAVFAVDCPDQTGKPSCSSELNQAFQTIATDILLKLTQ